MKKKSKSKSNPSSKSKGKSAVKVDKYVVLKSKVDAWLKEAKKKLMLPAWNVDLDWSLDRKGTNNSVTLMTMGSLPKYYDGTLTVYLKNCADCKDEVVRRHVYHELAHSILSEFSELAYARFINKEQLVNAEERAASLLAQILARLIKPTVV